MNPQRPLLTYVLPLRSTAPQVDREFCDYLKFISFVTETIVVDGSEGTVFEENEKAWGKYVRHVPPDPALATPMGKVGGVMTGVRLASSNKVIIADDDIRYGLAALEEISVALDDAQVVRPQNYFSPLPWHALWDSGRILLNRISGGDWPGTLGVSRSHLLDAGGYDGSVMFENLELVRTIIAAGGCEQVLLNTFVARRPSTTRHFFSQRVRQAYDEFARPSRLLVQLAILPISLTAVLWGRWSIIAILVSTSVVLAEIGRQRGDANRFFPFAAALAAPFWILERAVCAWMALASRIVYGGICYRGTVLRKAATSLPELRRRLQPAVVSAEPRGPQYQSV